jgi:hypothetical protein
MRILFSFLLSQINPFPLHVCGAGFAGRRTAPARSSDAELSRGPPSDPRGLGSDYESDVATASSRSWRVNGFASVRAPKRRAISR